ncbi:DUF4253 domain-containing protein [Gorillibacterium timonense]|uniref:DUF4253 domain-containing protein n=1 Tax=Gorillibacterium timonense TaxID=1689269 RepID=UPI00071C8BEC|nr:DUF4253 domain-containing protein [Gorillibacterium timonense]
MWLLFGVALALVYILITNQSRKKKLHKKKVETKPQGKQPIVPVRWTPDLSAEGEQEVEMARLSVSKEAYLPEEPTVLKDAAAEDADTEGTEGTANVEPGAPKESVSELPSAQASLALDEGVQPNADTTDDFEAELDAPAANRPDVRPEEVLGSDKIHSLWEAGRALEKLSGEAPRSFMTFDFGRRKYPQALSILTDEESARAWVDALQERLDGELLAFIGTTRWLGEEDEQGVEVVVAKGETPFDSLRLAQTDAANYDLSTEDIITKLKELDRRYGIRLYAVQTDSVGFELLRQPTNLQAFAEELYAFCPDLVDQGVGSIEHLIDYLKDHRDLHLWWD